MFGIFFLLMILQQINTQMYPEFCTQRTLYEARERPSKTYSWQAFMLANIVVEATWNSVSLFDVQANKGPWLTYS